LAAKRKFDVKFFKQFAYEGPLAAKLAQRDLEETLLLFSAED